MRIHHGGPRQGYGQEAQDDMEYDCSKCRTLHDAISGVAKEINYRSAIDSLIKYLDGIAHVLGQDKSRRVKDDQIQTIIKTYQEQFKKTQGYQAGR